MNDFLNMINAVDGVDAQFVARIHGVPVSTNREETVHALEPTHKQIVAAMGYPWSRCWRAEQVHGGDVAVVSAECQAGVVAGVDGLMTGAAGVMLAIYVADCGAVYIVDKKLKKIACVHSGKKGTEANITGRAISQMKERWGSEPSDLLVALAPCIRPPHYEVDFAVTIRHQVLQAGVPAEQYVDCGICTAEHVDDYYSYRLEKGNTGRMVALLGLS